MGRDRPGGHAELLVQGAGPGVGVQRVAAARRGDGVRTLAGGLDHRVIGVDIVGVVAVAAIHDVGAGAAPFGGHAHAEETQPAHLGQLADHSLGADDAKRGCQRQKLPFFRFL